jgi:hypothetical protein
MKKKKKNFSKFVTLKYLKIVRFPIAHFGILGKLSMHRGEHISILTFHENKIVICN